MTTRPKAQARSTRSPSHAPGVGEVYPAVAKMHLGRFSVTAIDVSAHDTPPTSV